jgi:hypothetical protein
MKPTFEQALWYLGRVRDELVHHSEREATVVMGDIDPQYPNHSPFTAYYGYPPYIPKEHHNSSQADVARDDDADDLWNKAYRLVNDARWAWPPAKTSL